MRTPRARTRPRRREQGRLRDPHGGTCVPRSPATRSPAATPRGDRGARGGEAARALHRRRAGRVALEWVGQTTPERAARTDDHGRAVAGLRRALRCVHVGGGTRVGERFASQYAAFNALAHRTRALVHADYRLENASSATIAAVPDRGGGLAVGAELVRTGRRRVLPRRRAAGRGATPRTSANWSRSIVARWPPRRRARSRGCWREYRRYSLHGVLITVSSVRCCRDRTSAATTCSTR